MPDRALFLDRDGVINEEVGYLYLASDVRFVENIFALCRTAQRLGYRLIVVTNQSGIARGLYTEKHFDDLMQWMEEAFQRQGVTIDAVYSCPFHPVHGIGSYRREHIDRKPGPGMLLRAARDLGIRLDESVMVGDRCTDVAAGNAAGVQQVFLLRGTESDRCEGIYQVVETLREVEAWLTNTAAVDSSAVKKA